MKNKNLPFNKSGKNLDFLLKCSFCDGDFEDEDATILEENEQKTTLHATCVNCRTSAIFFLSNNQAGIISLGMATDLDKTEVRDKFFRSAVSADEVIDAHQFFSEYKGDSNKLVENILEVN